MSSSLVYRAGREVFSGREASAEEEKGKKLNHGIPNLLVLSPVDEPLLCAMIVDIKNGPNQNRFLSTNHVISTDVIRAPSGVFCPNA